MPAEIRIVVFTLATSLISSIVLVLALSATSHPTPPALPSHGASTHQR